MDYLRMFGGGRGDNPQTESVGQDTVERLVERIETAQQYEDRRDAVKAIKSLARKYRLEVGSIALPVLMDTLKNDRSNPEILTLTLDALASVIGGEDGDTNDDEADELGERFAEIFINNRQHVSIVLGLLEEYEFCIRRPAIHLVTSLLRHCSHQLQEILLLEPTAIPKLMDLLQDSRDILRNDAILMLGELTRGNAHVQKLLAYENAFQYLFDIILNEGDSIVVEDCLFVALNLLKNNPSNQELFREQSMIQQISKWLHYTLWPSDDGELNGEPRTVDQTVTFWGTQKVSNVVFMFQLIRCLVAPSNPASLTAAAQRLMNESGILSELCDLLMASGATAEVLTEAIVTVAQVIRGCEANQKYFGTITAPEDTSTNPKSAVLVLIISMTNEKQMFELRCAVLYCFQAFLYKNDMGKHQIVGTLLPASAEQGQSMTAGHYLCTALVATEALQVWLASVALMHCLIDTQALKEQLLRVQLATSLGDPPVSLLQQVCSILSQGSRRAQIKSGLLMLLSVWLIDCPPAVLHFLHREENVIYLTQQIGDSMGGENDENEHVVVQGLCAFLLGICLLYNDDSVEKNNRTWLSAVIERRVGCERVVERLEALSRSEPYVRAAQRPHPYAKNEHELLLDHEFTKLFKHLEGRVLKELRIDVPHSPLTNGTVSAAEGHEAIVQSYKELIKRQDAQISDMTAQINKLHSELDKQRNLVKDTQNAAATAQSNQSEVENLRHELSEKCRLLDEANSKQMNEKQQTETQEDTDLKAQNAQLRYQVETQSGLIQQWQMEANRHFQFAQQWQQYQIAQLPDPTNQVIEALTAQQQELESQISYGWQMFEQQSVQLADAVNYKQTNEHAVGELQGEIENYKRMIQEEMNRCKAYMEECERLKTIKPLPESSSLEVELSNIRKEQEDLLVLLADQDQKLREYRRRLIGAGEIVTEDEVSDEDEDEDGGV